MENDRKYLEEIGIKHKVLYISCEMNKIMIDSRSCSKENHDSHPSIISNKLNNTYNCMIQNIR